VDTTGHIYLYLHGRGTRDYFNITTGIHPPMTGNAPNGQEWFSQPRSVTLAPNGDLLIVSNDSGFLWRVNNAGQPHLPSDLKTTAFSSSGMLLNWTGQFSRGYRVERTFSLDSPAWENIGAAPGTPSGIPSEFLDTDTAGHVQAFYRLLPSL
jgi:hypothetical protein